MTCDRILTLLNGVGVVISKRRVVRLLTVNLETFRAEDAEVLAAGLRGSSFVTVGDTGARHAGQGLLHHPPTASPRSAPGPASRAWLSSAACWAGRRPM